MKTRLPLFDGLANSDMLTQPWLDRAFDAGVRGMICNVAKGDDWNGTLQQIAATLTIVNEDARLTLARSGDEVRQAHVGNRLAVVLGCDQCDFVGHRLWRLPILAALGVRQIHLTYMYAELNGNGCGEGRDCGLTRLGRRFIAVVNELPMMLDLSHCGRHTAHDAIELARVPVFTHTAADAVHANRRNRTDEELCAVADKGGIVGLWNMPRSIGGTDATLDHLLEHVEHVVELIGNRSVGFGFDWTMALEASLRTGEQVPEALREHFDVCEDIFGTAEEFAEGRLVGLRTVDDIPRLVECLQDQGLDDAARAGLLMDNWINLLDRVCA